MSQTTAVPMPSEPGHSLRHDATIISLVGLAHLISHFGQLLLPPLFPWLKEALQASYAELGFLMTVFFAVSCAVQALSGFAVDRLGPRPVLFTGVTLMGLSAFGFALSDSYLMMLFFSLLAGTANGVFHPVNYTLLNRRVSASRLGHAYSAHGISGNLGWAVAPMVLVPLALAYSWRIALGAAGALIFAVLALMWLQRDHLSNPSVAPAKDGPTGTGAGLEGGLSFLRIPSVWLSFSFFFFVAFTLSIIQAFAPEAARQLHAVPVSWVALCLSIYMLSAAVGMVGGGFLASDPVRSERVVATGFFIALLMSLMLGLAQLPAPAVPLLFALMGLAVGVAGPSRDLLIKQATPDYASGRVYGVVYSGLDIGQALAPLLFGLLMDHQQYSAVLIGLALTQGALVVNALRMRKVSRSPVGRKSA